MVSLSYVQIWHSLSLSANPIIASNFQNARGFIKNLHLKLKKEKPFAKWQRVFGAGDEARTRYLHLGKVALYRMSYTRGNVPYYSTLFRFVNSFFDLSEKTLPYTFEKDDFHFKRIGPSSASRTGAQASISRSRLQPAFAGLVDGRQIASIPVFAAV